MPDTVEIPTNFAVLRRAVDHRRPCTFQILYAQSHNWGEYHTVENVGWVRQDEVYPVIRQHDSQIDPTIRTLRLQRQGQAEPQNFKFWQLPLYFMRNGARIPVFDFQYTHWIPNGYTPIPIPHEGYDALIQFINEMKQQRCHQITNPHAPILIPREQMERDLRTPPRRSHSPIAEGAPPRRRRGSLERRAQNEEDAIMAANLLALLEEEHRAARRPPLLEIPPPSGDDDFADLPDLLPFTPDVPSHLDLHIIEKPLLLPKHVGDLILADARRGNQDCPIAATPFRDCGQLTVTSCFHVFDRGSLGIWLQDHNTCPVCRTRVVNVVHE